MTYGTQTSTTTLHAIFHILPALGDPLPLARLGRVRGCMLASELGSGLRPVHHHNRMQVYVNDNDFQPHLPKKQLPPHTCTLVAWLV